MLKEFAILPEALLHCNYEGPKHQTSVVSQLKKALLHDGIVRDLKEGAWSLQCLKNSAVLAKNADELIKKLKKEGRLRPLASSSESADWLTEATASHAQSSLDSILVNLETAEANPDRGIYGNIHDLSNAKFWANPQSVRVKRTPEEMENALWPLFKYCPSVSFIDAHFNPSESRFDWLKNPIIKSAERRQQPVIEIHCSNHNRYKALGPLHSKDELKSFFKEWDALFKQLGVLAHITIWPNFHDRFVLTPQLGILASNSFDTTKASEFIVFSKLCREDKDAVYRDFDQNRGPLFCFEIGSRKS